MKLGVKKSNKTLLQYTFVPFTEISAQALKLKKTLKLDKSVLNREP